jgi:DUF177 domain-containing protein
MIIRVSELESEGLSVEDASQFATAFADPAWRLEGLSLHLTPDGKDVLVEGEIRATVEQDCSRCLESFRATVRARVDVRITPSPLPGSESRELGVDDLDTDFYANDELDLAGLVATETTLALPMKPLCRPDCRGLCPVCGGNRNADPCECQGRQPDPRLAVLKQLTARPKA